jgi:multiple antibiotic resistance protein
MRDILNAFMLVYAALIPIVNPIGSLPIFLNLTRDCSDADRQILARRVAVNSFFLLCGTLIVGSYVLEFFGITLPVLRVAGGLVVTAFGWRMLNAGTESKDHEDVDKPVGKNDDFYPLTMPLTVGPGSISVAITLGSHRPQSMNGFTHLVLLGGAAIVSLAAIAVTIYVCYRYAKKIVAWFGPHGTNVLVRLSAFILLCIGIEILWNGVRGLLDLAP